MKHDWEYKKLGEVASYINGYAFKPEEWTDKGLPIIRIQNLNNEGAIYNYFNGDIPAKYVVEDGDLLISWSASLGAYIWQGEKAYLNQHIFKVVFDKSDISKYYLKLVVESKLAEMGKSTHGATMKHITKKDFDNVPIPVPPLPTQQSIVSELDSLSKIIADCKETLKDYDALEQSIFFDMFGDPVKNDKGWEVKKLGEVAFAQNGLVSPTEEPYCDMIHVGPANIVSGTGELINLKTAKDENLISGKYLFDKDMILYSKIRPNLNKLTIAKFQGLCSADMYPIICGELLNPYYLASVLRHKRFLSYAIENSGRANIPKINREALFQFEMHLPPLPLQQQFASKIEAIEQMKSETKKALQEAETLFNARMDYWFN